MCRERAQEDGARIGTRRGRGSRSLARGRGLSGGSWVSVQRVRPSLRPLHCHSYAGVPGELFLPLCCPSLAPPGPSGEQAGPLPPCCGSSCAWPVTSARTAEPRGVGSDAEAACQPPQRTSDRPLLPTPPLSGCSSGSSPKPPWLPR